MPRWLRVVRGMVGTGLTFAVGVGVIGSVVGLAGLALGKLSTHDVMAIAGRGSVVAFLVGVVFSGALAFAARKRSFDKLSLGFVSAIGAGGGLLYFLAISPNAARVWSVKDAIGNFVILVGFGAVAAATTLLVARRAARALRPGDETHALREGMTDYAGDERSADREIVPRDRP